MPVFDPRTLRLYVVTSGAFGRGHREVAAAAIEGGATAIQLRAPELAPEPLAELAGDLASSCRAAGVLFVVNDALDAAMGSDDAGVHVGQDRDPASVRAVLGPARVLGVSVADPDQGRAAATAGADYVGVTVWATSTKPEAVGGGPALVRSVAEASGLPVVGIGGIGSGNAGQVLDAGAAGIAVISAVAAAKDPVAATRELRRLVDAHRSRDERSPA
jgi:thiamine-phosphate pyrophosphorylase